MTGEGLVADEIANRFLVNCLSSRRAPNSLRMAAMIMEGRPSPSWERVWQLADSGRIAPLVYHVTRETSMLPQWLRARCQVAYMETGILNALRLRELASLVGELDGDGIPVILLKGVALAENVYGNVGLRPMVDTDILVQRRNVVAALAVLQRCGYRQVGMEITPGATLAYENEILLRKEGNSVGQIELHWSLFDSPYYQRRLPETTIWGTAELIALENRTAYQLSPEWTLLHLCGHLAFHHQGTGLLWWNDVAELLYRFANRIQWPEVMAQAQAAHLTLALKLVLLTAADIWLAPVPRDVIEHLRSLEPAVDEISVGQELMAAGRSPGARLLLDARVINSWPERIRFIYHSLFPSAAYMDQRYQIERPSLRPFYYFYRWLIGLYGLLVGPSDRR